jgi:hypothetical protein
MNICVEISLQERQLGEACTSLAVKVRHVKKQKKLSTDRKRN